MNAEKHRYFIETIFLYILVCLQIMYKYMSLRVDINQLASITCILVCASILAGIRLGFLFFFYFYFPVEENLSCRFVVALLFYIITRVVLCCYLRSGIPTCECLLNNKFSQTAEVNYEIFDTENRTKSTIGQQRKCFVSH